MSEPSFGKLYHTQDGKTVFIDPKTNQAHVFEGVKTIEQIMEPKEEVVAPSAAKGEVSDLLKALMSQLPMIQDLNGYKMDLFMLPPVELINLEPDPEAGDILGPKDYFLLIPKEKESLLHFMPIAVHAWANEFRQGHHPEYKGYGKHRILPEQWNWLMNHKDCSVVGWYSAECPVFASVACQTHAKAMLPKLVPDDVKSSSEKPLFISSESLIAQPETIGAEEREV